MIQFVEWAIVNSLTVLVLAPVVWGLCRVCPWPSLRHTLWLVLLAKLVTPPLVTVDVMAMQHVWPEVSQEPAAAPLPVEYVAAELPPVPVESATASVLPVMEVKSIPAVAPVVALESPATASAMGVAPSASLPSVSRETWQLAARISLLVWAIVSVSILAIQSFRLVRFGRRLSRFSLGCDQLSEETAAAAARLGLPKYPQPRLVEGVVSPMLWGAGRWTRVLFPADLFEQLDTDARGTLLMHELAHYRRGDHWVRVLEFVVTALFWWHPVVWWALRELESAEEDCCDGWVMRHTSSSPRCYATALLDTIDFLCEQHPLAPPVASGLGNPTELRGRLVRIMTGTAQATLSPFGRVLTWSLIGVLPLQPAVFAGLGTELGRLIHVSRTDVSPLDLKASAVIEDGVKPARDNIELPPSSAQTIEIDRAPSVVPNRAKEWARALSADGRFQVVARTGGHIELHDLRKSRITDLTEWKIASMAFVPGTRTFVTGGFDRQVRLWDAVTGRPLQNLGEHPDRVVSVAVSHDGSTLATGSRDGTVSRWSLGPVLARTDVQLAVPVNCLCFAPDGSAVAVSTENWRSSPSGGLVLLDLANWTIRERVSLPSHIGALAFENGGNVLAAGAWDGTVHYLSANDFSPLLSIVSSKDAISAAGFSADTGAFPVLSLDEARTQVEQERARQLLEQQARFSLLQEFADPVERQPASTPAAR